MSKNFVMSAGYRSVKTPITDPDPFVNLFDDGSFKVDHQYQTPEEAAEAVPEKWRAGTKQVRVSELPKAVAK